MRLRFPWVRRRTWLVLALVLAIGAAAVVVALRRGARATHAADGPDARATDSMSGMAGMDMSGEGAVRLTADQLDEFGITFGSVEVRPLAASVRAAGIVTIDETRLAQVTPRVSGYVERLFVDVTGQPVRSGQPLYALYSPELVAAQEELLLAARLERDAPTVAVPGVPAANGDLLESAKRRLRLWHVSAAQIEGILRTGEVRQSLTFASPVSGLVIEKAVQQGQAVEAGRSLYTIADLSEVWVEAELRETDAAVAAEGVPATVELAAYPGQPIEGRVEYVYPTLQPEARTLKARIAVPNPDGRIKPGMYATVRLTGPERLALTVPSDAVVRTGERALVFVDIGGGRLQPAVIEPGQVAGDLTEVLAGLESGQRVVTSAHYLLESESNLGEVMKAMMGQMGQAEMPGTEM